MAARARALEGDLGLEQYQRHHPLHRCARSRRWRRLQRRHRCSRRAAAGCTAAPSTGAGVHRQRQAAVVGAYHLQRALESSHLQASLGKLALGIKVVDQQGARLDFLYCLVRNMSKFLSSLIFMLGYLMAAVTKNKQALHDLIAGSYVIRPVVDRNVD